MKYITQEEKNCTKERDKEATDKPQDKLRYLGSAVNSKGGTEQSLAPNAVKSPHRISLSSANISRTT